MLLFWTTWISISLLIGKPEVQRKWNHRIPETAKLEGPTVDHLVQPLLKQGHLAKGGIQMVLEYLQQGIRYQEKRIKPDFLHADRQKNKPFLQSRKNCRDTLRF